MPSGPNYTPDLATISSFFGASQNADGSWYFNGNEQIPANWTNRVTPYDNLAVTNQIVQMYLLEPVLFGANVAKGDFDGLGDFGSFIQGGKLSVPAPDGASVGCLLYQLATERVPASLNGIITPTVDAINLITSKVAPAFQNLGCPIPLTR